MKASILSIALLSLVAGGCQHGPKPVTVPTSATVLLEGAELNQPDKRATVTDPADLVKLRQCFPEVDTKAPPESSPGGWDGSLTVTFDVNGTPVKVFSDFKRYAIDGRGDYHVPDPRRLQQMVDRLLAK